MAGACSPQAYGVDDDFEGVRTPHCVADVICRKRVNAGDPQLYMQWHPGINRGTPLLEPRLGERAGLERCEDRAGHVSRPPPPSY